MRIGPSFVEELEAAGVLRLPFAWGTDGQLTFSPAITPQQRAIIEAVLAAHDPTKPSSVVDDLREPYQNAKQKVEALVADSSIPASVRQAVGALAAYIRDLSLALARHVD